jgi:hypothetical protein
VTERIIAVLEEISSKLGEVSSKLDVLISKDDQKEFLSIGEVVKLTESKGVTAYAKWTLQNACNNGQVPGAFKEGKQWYLPKKEVEKILQWGLPKRSA